VGVDLNLFKLLIVLRSKVQVPFGRCLTVGRQQIHFEASEARAAWQAMRCNDFANQSGFEYGEYCEKLLAHLGATSVESIDASDYEGATIVHDLNKPLPASLSGRFDTVIDFGTIEHVFDVPQVLRTYASLVSDGGTILIATQADGSCGHGFYQFSPELFYRFFSQKDGFETKCFLVPCGSSRRSWIFSPDPASSNSRIEFPVLGKTYVAAIAKRHGALGTFDKVQQSDYTVLWNHNAVTFYTRQRFQLPAKMLSLTRPIYTSAKKWLRDTALGHAAERGLKLRLLPIKRFKPEDFPDYRSLNA
jgi:hypothetical protein